MIALGWVMVAVCFAFGFGFAIAAVIGEARREAPVETYRRQLAWRCADPMRVADHAPTEIPQAAIYPVPKCPVCDVEMQGRIKRWDRPYPVAFFCLEHGSERVEVR